MYHGHFAFCLYNFVPKYLYLPTVSLCSMILQTLQGAPLVVVLFVNGVKKIFDYYMKKKTAT